MIAAEKRKLEIFGAIRIAQQIGLSDSAIVEHLRTNFKGMTQEEATACLHEFETMAADKESQD